MRSTHCDNPQDVNLFYHCGALGGRATGSSTVFWSSIVPWIQKCWFHSLVSSIFSGGQTRHITRSVLSLHPEHIWCDFVHPSRVGGGSSRMARGILHRLYLLRNSKYQVSTDAITALPPVTTPHTTLPRQCCFPGEPLRLSNFATPDLPF